MLEREAAPAPSGNDGPAAPEPSAEARIVAFLCNWCSYAGADLAGTKRLPIPASVRTVRVMCSGRVDPTWVLEALRAGAWGVLVLGCHPGDCHYRAGNEAARRRWRRFTALCERIGIERERIRLDWVAASEGARFQEVTRAMAAAVAPLGPLPPLVVNPSAPDAIS